MFREIVEFSKIIEEEELFKQKSGEDSKIYFKVLFTKSNDNLKIKDIKFIEKGSEEEKFYNKLYINYGIPLHGDNNKSLGGSTGLYTASFLCFRYSDKDIMKKWENTYNEENYKKIYSDINNFQELKLFFDWVIRENNSRELIEKINMKIEEIRENIEKKVKFIIMFWFDFLNNDDMEKLYRDNYERYKECKIFLKENETYDKRQCPICLKNNVVLGMPISFNNLSEKKPFIVHRSKKIAENIIVCAKCSEYIYKFEELFLDTYKVRLFPLFIDLKLMSKEIHILKRFKNIDEEISFEGFKKILYSVNKYYKNELSFLLVLYNNKDKILSIDYITGYKYYIDTPLIEKAFIDFEKEVCIKNIFHIEKEIDYLLDGELIKNYFETKIVDKKGKTFLSNLIYKNREGIFNLIYRNNKNEFSLKNLEEIFFTQIKNKILNDDDNNNIIEYIDRFIVSYQVLKNNFYSEQGGIDMGKLKNIRDELFKTINEAIKNQSELRSSIQEFFENKDDETKKYAYALLLGQIVYYILSHSKTSNKNHALLEGFSNVGSLGVLSNRIIEYFEKYKHEISFNFEKFNQIMSLVLEFCVEKKEQSFKEIELPFYIGYFDSNIFYQKSN